MKARAIAGVLWLALLVACAGGKPRPTAPSTFVPALAAPGTATARTAEQIVHAAYGDRGLVFQCVVQLSAGNLRVIGLDARGQRLFTIGWDGHTIEETRAPFVPATLTADRLLADLQLVLWPIAAIAPFWESAGFGITEPYPGMRRVVHDGRIVEEVHYAGDDPWRGRSWLVNFAHGYSLTIDSREVVD